MALPSSIQNVSDTSFWVAHYRAKESARPDALFNDPLAAFLTSDRGEAFSKSMGHVSRYSEWSVISRTVIIDRMIEQLVNDGVDAVINLGAGLDTRPFRMNLPEALEWIEVDYENIIAYKNEALHSEKSRCRLTRVALDISLHEERKKFLTSVLPHAKKVLILTEGVIPYLSEEQVAALSVDLFAQNRIRYWITEYFHPKVYRHLQSADFAQKMKNAPFRFFPADWLGFFKSLGWVAKEVRFTSEIAREFNRLMPMPSWARLILRLMPKKMREESIRMSGHVIFQKH
jgi:methyltransferase (TIGR00027 family)